MVECTMFSNNLFLGQLWLATLHLYFLFYFKQKKKFRQSHKYLTSYAIQRIPMVDVCFSFENGLLYNLPKRLFH
jgi:hypothetical protein